MGTPVTTIDRLREVFIESLHLNLHKDELPDDRRLDEVAGLDSIAILEFVAAAEKEFDITIEPESLELSLVRDLRRFSIYIDARLAARIS